MHGVRIGTTQTGTACWRHPLDQCEEQSSKNIYVDHSHRNRNDRGRSQHEDTLASGGWQALACLPCQNACRYRVASTERQTIIFRQQRILRGHLKRTREGGEGQAALTIMDNVRSWWHLLLSMCVLFLECGLWSTKDQSIARQGGWTMLAKNFTAVRVSAVQIISYLFSEYTNPRSLEGGGRGRLRYNDRHTKGYGGRDHTYPMVRGNIFCFYSGLKWLHCIQCISCWPWTRTTETSEYPLCRGHPSQHWQSLPAHWF
jgi:hypothetical protein